MAEKFVRTSLNITEKQRKFLHTTPYNASKLFRQMLDELMEKEK